MVHGNFRQVEIIKNWKNTIVKLNQKHINNLPTIKVRAEVSKRTYIRALVRDIGKELHIAVTTHSIVRTENQVLHKMISKIDLR